MAQLAGLRFPPSTLTASRAVLRPAGWRPACALAKVLLQLGVLAVLQNGEPL